MNDVLEQYAEIGRVLKEKEEIERVIARNDRDAKVASELMEVLKQDKLKPLMEALNANELRVVSENSYRYAEVPIAIEHRGFPFQGTITKAAGDRVALTLPGIVRRSVDANDDEAIGLLMHSVKLECDQIVERRFRSALYRLRWSSTLDELDDAWHDAMAMFPDQADNINECYQEKKAFIEADLEVKRQEAAERDRKEQEYKARQAEQQRRQMEVWYPFYVYEVHYAIGSRRDADGDDLNVVTDALYTLAAESTADGWWPAVNDWDGGLRMVRLAHIVRIDRIAVIELGRFCRLDDGIWYPPAGAQRMPQ